MTVLITTITVLVLVVDIRLKLRIRISSITVVITRANVMATVVGTLLSNRNDTTTTTIMVVVVEKGAAIVNITKTLTGKIMEGEITLGAKRITTTDQTTSLHLPARDREEMMSEQIANNKQQTANSKQ